MVWLANLAVGPDDDAAIMGFLYEMGAGADAMVFAVSADIITSEGKIDYGLILYREFYSELFFRRLFVRISKRGGKKRCDQ